MIRIGVINARSTADVLSPVFERFKDQCEYTFLLYEKLEEIKHIFNNNRSFFDGFILGGPLPYFYLEHEIHESSIPTVYLDLTEKDFYKHLFKISRAYKTLQFSRVFIDFLWEGNRYYDLLELLQTNEIPIHLEENDIDWRNERLYEDMLKKHIRLWNEGKIDLSITRIANIVKPMKEHGINVYYMSISKDTIEEKIKDLFLEIEYFRLKKNQIVVGYIESPSVDHSTDIEFMQISFHKALLEFSRQHQLQLSIQKSNFTIEIITSYGELQTITNDFHTCRLVRFLQDRLPFRVNIGWGIGTTLGQAFQYAKNAYREARSYPETCSFVINENKKYMGPLGFNEKYEVEYSDSAVPQIDKLSNQIDISIFQLQKIITAMSKLKTTELTSYDAAEALGVSVRSANRLLNQMVEKNLAEVKHKKQNSTKGRPIKVYTIRIPSVSNDPI
ncbi:hypothetical protein [Pseudalkalibacillus decolorationis]|uniref:hypothetical protein n=1 Tax=Pseudalkalibacillus decolorationis TaxID=163879 RepID=UPI00214797E6|nr:hypothetical protein [Pseudalkalibacillus decolorationis]